MVNELKRYVKYNSEKLWFLKLRNKFFNRLRNRGFRKYYLSKLFASVSYSSRDKYLFSNENIFSDIIQETQAEAAISDLEEKVFQDHLHTSDREQNKAEAEGETYDNIKNGKTSPTDKVKSFKQLSRSKKTKCIKDYSLGCVFPGECYEIKQDIQNIFEAEYKKACLTSHIGAVFNNEKNLGALISKSKL